MNTGYIDAHHHLWRYVPPGPAWMGEGMETLRHDFLLDALKTVTSEAGVTGTIVVETQRTVTETEWLSRIAASNNLILGVVGWAPLTTSSARSEIEKAAALPKMMAIRHPIHDEPDDQFVLREDFNRGISVLKSFNLRYDILIFETHLPQTIQFVDRHPNQIFILDHLAKPRIREGVLDSWRDNIRQLALRPNVYCKISGMVTEADWRGWSHRELRPYFDTVLEAFTPERLMFGSDWPVVTLACSYPIWFDTVRVATAQLSRDERDWIFAKTAIAAYGLAMA